MWSYRCMLTAWALFALALGSVPASAELQDLTVDGAIRLRGNYWMDTFNQTGANGLVASEGRIPASFFRARAIGDVVGGQRPTSFYDWDSDNGDYSVVEQRTVLGVTAKFTEGVSARVALESFDAWGEDFRSDYVTGADMRAASGDDVEIYEAYINAENYFGHPVRFRLGRQELNFGAGWLVGDSSAHPEFRGLSFDAIRYTYQGTDLTADVFAAKLVERVGLENDGDIDFYGIYGSYAGLTGHTLDAYWFFLRDARHVEDGPGGPIVDQIEDLLGVNDYGVTRLHTIGLRASGQFGAFDYEAEAARQFGQADQVGQLFSPFGYGDDGADFEAWALHLAVGYQFDTAWQPRVHLGTAYFGGEDNRDLSFGEWLNPFHQPEASISFNRLFSNVVYSHFLDEMSQLSNCWIMEAGVSVQPTERLDLSLRVASFQADEAFDLPRPMVVVGGQILNVASPFTFVTRESSDDLGWETQLAGSYRYSDDLVLRAGWSHFFTGDGLADGNYVDLHGLGFNRGTDDQDGDYLFWELALAF